MPELQWLDLRSRARRSLMGNGYRDQEVTGDFRNSQGFFATYQNIIFKNCQMGKSNFSRSIFEGCYFDACQLGMTSFNSATIKDSNFADCDLDQATFSSATILRSIFKGGRAQYAEFERAAVIDVLFEMDLHGADLRFGEGRNVDYGDSSIWGASIKFSCSQFKDAKISDRMFKYFLTLLSTTVGNDELRASVLTLVDPKYREAVGRMALMEIE